MMKLKQTNDPKGTHQSQIFPIANQNLTPETTSKENLTLRTPQKPIYNKPSNVHQHQSTYQQNSFQESNDNGQIRHGPEKYKHKKQS